MDAERLLGSFVRSALTGRRASGLSKAALGIGALGVAIAAYEHFSQRSQAPPPPPGDPGSGAVPPPPPPGPPPAQPATSAAPVAAGPPASEALLLVRAMVAAAYADGRLDAEEQARIRNRLDAEELTDEERREVEQALASPISAEALAAQVGSAELAEQVYGAALLAITVDTDEERQFLARLAAALHLPAEAVARMHRLFGVPRCQA